MKKPKHTSTVVSNHVSWLDGHILLSQLGIAIAPDAGFADAPILGQCLKALDCLFMPRAFSEAEKENALLTIKTRQENIEEKGNYPPLLVFAEGGTSNGTHILQFKKGAFYFEKTIKPVVLKYTFTGYSTDYALFDPMALVILTLCYIGGGLKCEMMVLPDFQPNEFMYTKFADKGKERWEAYVWCLRDVMAKTGGMKLTDIPNRAKLAYWKWFNGKVKIDDFENKTVDQIIDDYNKI